MGFCFNACTPMAQGKPAFMHRPTGCLMPATPPDTSVFLFWFRLWHATAGTEKLLKRRRCFFVTSCCSLLLQPCHLSQRLPRYCNNFFIIQTMLLTAGSLYFA